MKGILLVLERATLPLARRWWDTHADAEIKCVLVIDADESSLQEVRRWGRNVPVAGSPEEAKSRTAFCHAHLILEVAITPMYFLAGGYTAGLGKYTSTFSELHRLGVKRVSLDAAGLGGEFALEQTIDSYIGRHEGERCFVIGNGPSLAQTDMSLLRDEITLGSNRCYLGFERWGFPFRYWGCIDVLQMEEYASEYESCLPQSTVKFIPFEFGLFSKHRNQCFFNQEYEVLPRPLFSRDPSVVHMGNSVTYSLMQLGALMGCKQIILLGVDHSYPVSIKETQALPAPGGRVKQAVKGFLGDSACWEMAAAARRAYRRRKGGEIQIKKNPQREVWTIGDASGPTHFDQRYTEGKKFVPPRLELIERAFASAKEWGEENGVEILNATPGTKLDVFPKVRLEDVISARL